MEMPRGMSRASTETVASESPSLVETTAGGKRQPRKLTKSRNSSEATPEKAKAVLQKKVSSRQSTISVEEGQAELSNNGG
jgi:hypothetical protein